MKRGPYSLNHVGPFCHVTEQTQIELCYLYSLHAD